MRWVSALLLVASAASGGCAVPKQMFAATDDLADYRAFRMAVREGTRLSLAESYLGRHPKGAWADEVHRAFEAEEPRWFEHAKRSRSAARDYIVDLPEGPHAAAANAVMASFDAPEADLDTLELLAQARESAAFLDLQAERRRRLGELILEELGALLDPDTLGATLDQAPDALAGVLRGAHPCTWGKCSRAARRNDEFYFGLPTPTDIDARVAEVRLELVIERDRIIGGRVEGEDLFVRWAEANEVRALDPTAAADRAEVAKNVADLLGGALEARFPVAYCAAQPLHGEIVARACDGRQVSVRMGLSGRQVDVIEVRSAPTSGMR